jgi:triosephosphate isomerase (TIM)
MKRVPLIAGNWKMNTSRSEALALARGVAECLTEGIDVAVCPPFPWMTEIQTALAGTAVKLGAQNCWSETSGAFTGEVSPTMLAEICDLVIIGHSERRRINGESDELVASKIRAALAADLTVILCVGEDLETREAGNEVQFVHQQLSSALDVLRPDELSKCVIAYEPIWAIGTGVAAEPSDAQVMASAIRYTIPPEHAETTRILYGGSVTASNAEAILSQPDVDGALVGGASLKLDQFTEIVSAASRCARLG